METRFRCYKVIIDRSTPRKSSRPSQVRMTSNRLQVAHDFPKVITNGQAERPVQTIQD